MLVTVVALSLVSGVTGAQGPAHSTPIACSTTVSASMTPFDTTKVAGLVGTYDVVMYDTTSLNGPARQHAGKLSLWFQDSLPRRQATMARAVHHKYLVGTFEVAAPDSGDTWTSMTSRDINSPGVFWSDGFLRLGEFGPKSGISLYVRAVEHGEIRGMWTSHAGTAIIVDFTGEREPDEAGYFCAKRLN